MYFIIIVKWFAAHMISIIRKLLPSNNSSANYRNIWKLKFIKIVLILVTKYMQLIIQQMTTNRNTFARIFVNALSNMLFNKMNICSKRKPENIFAIIVIKIVKRFIKEMKLYCAIYVNIIGSKIIPNYRRCIIRINRLIFRQLNTTNLLYNDFADLYYKFFLPISIINSFCRSLL